MDNFNLYFITYTDTADVREQRVFRGWFEDAKCAVLGFHCWLAKESVEDAKWDFDSTHSIKQILNNFNLYHNSIQIVDIYSNPTLVASSVVDFSRIEL